MLKTSTLSNIIGPAVVVHSSDKLFIGELLSSNKVKNIFGKTVSFEVHSILGNQKYAAMAFEDCNGLVRGTKLISKGKSLEVPVGNELIGRMIDVYGHPLDHGSKITSKVRGIYHPAPKLVDTPLNKNIFSTDVKAIDIMCPCLKGGKTGIIGGAGVGKTCLLLSIASKLVSLDQDSVVIFAGVGERSGEALSIYNYFHNQVRTPYCLVISTMDDAPGTRARSLWSAISIAEGFRDQGKDVFLLVDSIYRHLAAETEVFGFLGQLPGPLGTQPTTYTDIGKIHGRISSNFWGTITGFETVYLPSDDLTDPTVFMTFPQLDTAIILDRKKCYKNLYPAIDLISSSSQGMDPAIIGRRHYDIAQSTRAVLQKFEDLEGYISLWGMQELPKKEQILVMKAQKLSKYFTTEDSGGFKLNSSLEHLERI